MLGRVTQVTSRPEEEELGFSHPNSGGGDLFREVASFGDSGVLAE
jgi:hypothetical protein